MGGHIISETLIRIKALVIYRDLSIVHVDNLGLNVIQKFNVAHVIVLIQIYEADARIKLNFKIIKNQILMKNR